MVYVAWRNNPAESLQQQQQQTYSNKDKNISTKGGHFSLKNVIAKFIWNEKFKKTVHLAKTGGTF